MEFSVSSHSFELGDSSTPQENSGNNPVTYPTENEKQESEKPSKRKREAYSEVWNHFTKFTRDDKPRAKCNYCGNSYACDIRIHGTSSLSAHIRKCKKFPHNNETHQAKLAYQQSITSALEGGKVGTVKTWVFDQEKVRKALAHMVIVDEQPFSMVERKGFSHKGEAIGKVIENCLHEWGIDKVFSITVDNASSNDTAISYLKKRFLSWGAGILGCKYLHVRCVAHIINLVVNDELKEMGTSISRVRAAVRYIRQSPARLKKFKECVDKGKCQSKKLLCLDVPTRWNSTYLMLDTAEKFEKVFERYEELDPHFRLDLEQHDEGVSTEDDWVIVRRFVLFLHRFYQLILRISGSLYVTSNIVFREISGAYGILKKYEASCESDIRAMADRMKKKYDKYWGNTEKSNFLIYIAAILDPRSKFDFVDFVLDEMYGSEMKMGKLVNEALYELFGEYKRLSNINHPNTSTSSHLSSECVNSESSLFAMGYEDDNIYWHMFHAKCGSDSKSPYVELDRYLNEMKQEPKPDFQVLNWWKENESKFPIVSQMARDIFAVPVSTVASESTFSMGGRVLDTFRSSLTPRIAQAIICSRDWLRASASPISIEEDLDTLETMEEDLSKISIDSAIVDM